MAINFEETADKKIARLEAKIIALEELLNRHRRTVLEQAQETNEHTVERALRESEEKYRILFESSWDAIMTLDPPDWKFTSGNPATIAMFQARDEADFTARGPWEVSPANQPDGRSSSEKAKIMIGLAMSEGVNYFEWTHKRLNGEEFPATVLLTRVRIRERVFLQATVRDVSHQARMELSLRDSEERFRSLAATAQDAIVMTEDGDRITFWNPTAEKMFGWTAEEVIGKNLHPLLAPSELLPLIRERLTAFRAEGVGEAVGKTLELPAKRKNGSVFPLELSLSRVKIASGWQAIGIGRDMTERKAATEKILESKQQLEEAHRQLQENHKYLLQSEKMAAIGQLAAGVAHEINNPVGFVTSNLGTLKEYVSFFKRLTAAYEQYAVLSRRCPPTATQGALDEQWRIVQELRKNEDYDYVCDDVDQLLSESLEGVERVKDIVQGLKSFARSDENKVVESDLNDCLDNTLKVIGNELKYKCRVSKKYSPLPPLRCRAGELNQVFMNLLVNAAQAIQEWGEIVIETAADTRWVYVRIRDTGCGIAPENQKKLFEPFFTTKPVGKGTGLGLAISYNIVKKHGGKIEVESTPGVGTQFTVKLPSEGAPE